MELNEHYCLFCLSEIIPYVLPPDDSGGGALPNFNLISDYLGVKVPVERHSDSNDLDHQRESIFNATCDKFLCFSCFERVNQLRILYKQLEEIKGKIGNVTQVIKSIIVDNSTFSTIITGGSLSQFDFDKVLRNHVRQVTTLSSIWQETIDIESIELKFNDGQDVIVTEETLEIPPHDGFGLWSSIGHAPEEDASVDKLVICLSSTSTSSGEDSSNCPIQKVETNQDTFVAEVNIKEEHSPECAAISTGAFVEVEVDGKKMVQCPHCGKFYERIKSLRNHIARNHNTVNDGTLQFYTCHLCDDDDADPSSPRKIKKYKNEEALQRHNFFRHIKGPKYKCQQCPKSYYSNQQLNNHVNSEHRGVRHPCPECSKEFINQSHLRRHVKLTHTRTDLYSCSLCPKTFALPWELRRHMIFHDDNATKDFICDTCGKKFLTRPQLTNHVYEVHQAERSKRYQCSECPAKFRGRLQLEYHVRTHTGEKPFECHFCERGFAQKSQLNKHVKVIHEQIPKKRGRRPKIKEEFVVVATY